MVRYPENLCNLMLSLMTILTIFMRLVKRSLRIMRAVRRCGSITHAGLGRACPAQGQEQEGGGGGVRRGESVRGESSRQALYWKIREESR